MNKFTTTGQTFARPLYVEAARREWASFRSQNPQIDLCDVVIIDLCGILRGKRMRMEDAAKIFDNGMQIPESVYLMDVRGEMTDVFGHGYGDGDPDGSAWPIPQTLSQVWGADPPRAQILTSLCDERGRAFIGEPRSTLVHVAEQFAPLGLTPVTALELEFYLLDPLRDLSGKVQPPLCPRSGQRESEPSVYGIDDLDRYQAFLASLNDAAKMQNLPLTTSSKEYAPGQFEANLLHQDNALRAADHAVFLKQIVKNTARAHGFEASFMAKIFPRHSGSGLHVHVSLLNEAGQNIFADAAPDGSSALHHAIGGLQRLMGDCMAFFAPNRNAYRRYQPDMFAPSNSHWGVNNRAVGLRIPLSVATARRVEHRISGADANPYLVLAAVLAGIHYGLTRRCDPGPPSTGNVPRRPDPHLPHRIDAALQSLASSTILPAYFDTEFIALYGETKRIEAERFHAIIPSDEYDWYL